MDNKTAIETDVLITGAGPAGMSAALWCAELGLRSTVLDLAARPGGQMLAIHSRIINYPGVICKNGDDLAKRFVNSLQSADCKMELKAEISAFEMSQRQVRLRDGRRYKAGAIIIATGVSRRTLGVEGENTFFGNGLLTSGVKDQAQVAGHPVAVIGGGDAAVENALILSEIAKKVYLIHRREHLSARDAFVRKALRHPRVEYRPNTIVREFKGNNRLETLEICDLRTGNNESLHLDYALIRIGVEPNTQLFASKLKLDTAGYIVVNRRCETSIPGVFAAGDVANPISPTISSAAGMGATAAKAAFSFLRHDSPLMIEI